MGMAKISLMKSRQAKLWFIVLSVVILVAASISVFNSLAEADLAGDAEGVAVLGSEDAEAAFKEVLSKIDESVVKLGKPFSELIETGEFGRFIVYFYSDDEKEMATDNTYDYVLQQEDYPEYNFGFNSRERRDSEFWSILNAYSDMIGARTEDISSLYPGLGTPERIEFSVHQYTDYAPITHEESGIVFHFTNMYAEEDDLWCYGIELPRELSAVATPANETLLNRLHNDRINYTLQRDTDGGSYTYRCTIIFHDVNFKFILNPDGYRVDDTTIDIFWTPRC